MKKVLSMIAIAVMVISAAMAAGDDLSELDTQMGPTDTHTVEYCVYDIVPPNGTIDVVVDPVCKDVDGVSGCNGEDIHDPADFSATPAADLIETVDGQGCVDIMLETTDAEGLYYYTVNGESAETEIVAETGSVAVVPEFSVLGATLALGAVGLFIHKKRK